MCAVTQLAHHGMIFVPIGSAAGMFMGTLDEVRTTVELPAGWLIPKHAAHLQ